MSEWLYEEGIGENRAALVERGEIIEAEIETTDDLRVGSVLAGRLTTILIPARRGIVTTASRAETLLEPLPSSLTEGGALHVVVTREGISETGRAKLPRCRVADGPERAGPSLLDRLLASGGPLRRLGWFDADALEAAGWSELLEQAATGEVAFDGGRLQMSLTPAMTLFDVDGALPPAELAIRGAAAAAKAIRRFGIGGSIGIDLPTLASRHERQAAAKALDDALPQPFERTAVNGFGFLQVVRKRERPSIPERIRADPAGAAARMLLRRAERNGGHGRRTIRAAPPVVARLEARPEWLEALGRRLGAPVALQADAALAISAGHVHSASP